MKLTPAREIWLKQLRDKGPGQHCKHGGTRFACHEAGLTEWVYRDDNTGELLSLEEAKEHYGHEFWENVHSDGERITEAGLKVIEGK